MDKIESLNALFGADVSVRDGRVTVARDASLASPAMDRWFAPRSSATRDEKDHARWLIWEFGQAVGVRAASIQDLYMARGRGETHGFTVPAINVRGMSYDTARAIFRTAIKLEAGAFILEIARSEIAYTDQRPGRVRRRDARRRAARRVPRPGLHSGRSLPGQRTRSTRSTRRPRWTR